MPRAIRLIRPSSKPLDHLGDLARAADRPEPVLGHPDDAELGLLVQAAPDHRLVALLEDVQRDELGRERDEAEREQREVLDERHEESLRSYSGPAMPELYLQRDQPPGVPPLALTGERTLPDVPEENYWYRRHLVVYEWIAERVAGPRVVDLACGEGYGSAVLARTARVGRRASTPTPRRSSTRALKYTTRTMRFERDLIDAVDGRRRLRRVPADDRARPGPGRDARRTSRELVGPGGIAFVSTPNVLTLAPAGRARAPATRGTSTSTARRSSARCASATSARSTCYGLFHARKLALHALALEARLGRRARAAAAHEALLRPLHAGDRRARLRAARARRRSTARWTSWPSAGLEHRPRCDRPAHPHALRRGLRDVAVRRGVAVGGDRDVLPAAARRARRAPRPRHAVGDAGAVRPARGARRARSAAARSCATCATQSHRARHRGRRPPRCAPRSSTRGALRARRRRSTARRPAGGASRRTRRGRRAATHAILPLLATGTGRSAAAADRHRRRTARASASGPAGFWLPECAHAPWLDRCSRRPASGSRASTDRRPRTAVRSCARTADGVVLVPIDRELIELVWARDGYPSRRAYLEHAPLHRAPPPGRGRSTARPTTRTRARAQARADADDFVARVAARRLAVVVALDTELLGHWWAEGVDWLAAPCSRRASVARSSR